MNRARLCVKLFVFVALLGVLAFVAGEPRPAYAIQRCGVACPATHPQACSWACQCGAFGWQVVMCSQCPDNGYVCGEPAW